MIYSPHCKAMVYTIEECDAILEERIKNGDLRPDRILKEQLEFYISIGYK